VTIGGATFTLPVLGYRLTLPGSKSGDGFATFEDGGIAAVDATLGRGRVIGLGFLPMLAYGQLARFQPTTLAERWPAEPRMLIEAALKAGGVGGHVSSNVPVVEASLLSGPAGSAVVLANYTYERIPNLQLRIDVGHKVTSATSVEGQPVQVGNEGGKTVLDRHHIARQQLNISIERMRRGACSTTPGRSHFPAHGGESKLRACGACFQSPG
jgi:hypothetical protein